MPIAPLAGESYHLLGLTGRGMAPLAMAAAHLGAEVSGCDRAPRRDTTPLLEAAGFEVEVGHSPDHAQPGQRLVHTSVASAEEPELAQALEQGRAWHRTDLLAHILRRHPGAGITGSHGKGTVTALTAGALAAAGLDPVAIIGVPVPAFEGTVRLGQGPTVAEVDDSDLTLRSVDTKVAVVTNLDQDHPHLAIPLAEVTQAVGEYVARASDLVILGASPRAAALAEFANAPVWRYGVDFSARVVSAHEGATELDVRLPGGVRVRGVVRLLGPRSAENGAVALATAVALGADAEQAAAGLATVDRIERRMEPIGVVDGVRVFDDFGAKHPVNVRTGLVALRRHFPQARIIAVFEAYGPYLVTWGHRYALALSGADRVIVAPPAYSADYDPGPDAGSDWVQACSAPWSLADGRPEAVREAMALANPGDVVVFFAQIHSGRVMARMAVGEGP